MEGRPEAPEPYYPPTYAPEPVAPQPIAPRPKWKSALGVLGAIGLVILKFGAKLKAVLLLLPKLKLFTTSASMLVSIGAYALLWGWKFGVGLVLLLLVHELGHVWQARREGLDASAPLFIPFLGAAIALKELPKDAAVEARVGLAGPIIGSLGTCVPLAIWLATGEEFWQALAFFGFFLNLLQPRAGAPARRRPRDGRAHAVDVDRRLRAARRRHDRVPEPDHAAHPDLRRPRDLAPLEGAEDARGAALLRGSRRARAPPSRPPTSA